MSKRTWAVLAAGALFASVLAIGPASAQDAPPAIPAEPNIVDPAQDANGLNDQGVAPDFGDQPGGVYFGAADILEVWFTNDDKTFTVNVHTSTAGGTGNYGYRYRIHANDDCVWFHGLLPGAISPGDPAANIQDVCNDQLIEGGQIAVHVLPDETAITTMTYELGAHSAIVPGATIAAPFATTRLRSPAASAPQADNTVAGTDYTISTGGSSPKPDPGPPSDGEVGNDDPNTGGPDNPPVKKGCKKGKGKKKGCKKPKKTAGCAAYQPGEQGAEAETFVVKDEHTAEAPLELTIEQEMGQGGDLGVGVYDGAAHTFRNLQVDSKAAEAGLYIRYEFPVYEDHDLYVNYASGSEAAHVGGFNMTPVGIFDGTGAGGHSEQGAEQIDGLRTADCGGYTIDFSNYLGEGGEYTVKVWLGEIQNDPAPPA